MAVYGRKVSDFADYCEQQGMPLSYHHHMGAVVENEAEPGCVYEAFLYPAII